MSGNPLRWPLGAQIVLAVAAGAAIGHLAGTGSIIPGLSGPTTAHLGRIGELVIRLLTALALPLILFAVLDAFLRTQITGRQGLRFAVICVVNLAVAMTLGLTVMNVFRPGEAWHGKLAELRSAIADGAAAGEKSLQADISLSPMDNIDRYVPRNVMAPFLESNVIGLVLLAAILGIAFRHVRDGQTALGQSSYQAVEAFVETTYAVLMRGLELVVTLVPLALLGIVAKVVGESGLAVFRLLGGYLVYLGLGLLVYALLYYPLAAWIVGGRPPAVYLGRGADAVVTGFSANSSLATVPVTLRCLTERMGVSPGSARLAACIGTNFNNDGITLYEAMSALFITQAVGSQMGTGEQITLILASLMASIGVAGVPASGLIILPLVLRSVGLSDEVIGLVYPLIASVDWILARVRSAVNVLGDMQVAILLDGRSTAPPHSAAEDTVVER
jgi:DAACS family dicarboxylate/amino acid:cation (Na+ or H+) symporter